MCLHGSAALRSRTRTTPASRCTSQVLSPPPPKATPRAVKVAAVAVVPEAAKQGRPLPRPPGARSPSRPTWRALGWRPSSTACSTSSCSRCPRTRTRGWPPSCSRKAVELKRASGGGAPKAPKQVSAVKDAPPAGGRRGGGGGKQGAPPASKGQAEGKPKGEGAPQHGKPATSAASKQVTATTPRDASRWQPADSVPWISATAAPGSAWPPAAGASLWTA
mmetsp:Transcript_24209/g.65596  ORF Transcript_24209/g.65596 Transcript_24209/m.65596 type:complete len:220 (+) Transcript_24209:401-1060(+)